MNTLTAITSEKYPRIYCVEKNEAQREKELRERSRQRRRQIKHILPHRQRLQWKFEAQSEHQRERKQNLTIERSDFFFSFKRREMDEIITRTDARIARWDTKDDDDDANECERGKNEKTKGSNEIHEINERKNFVSTEIESLDSVDSITNFCCAPTIRILPFHMWFLTVILSLRSAAGAYYLMRAIFHLHRNRILLHDDAKWKQPKKARKIKIDWRRRERNGIAENDCNWSIAHQLQKFKRNARASECEMRTNKMKRANKEMHGENNNDWRRRRWKWRRRNVFVCVCDARRGSTPRCIAECSRPPKSLFVRRAMARFKLDYYVKPCQCANLFVLVVYTRPDEGSRLSFYLKIWLQMIFFFRLPIECRRHRLTRYDSIASCRKHFAVSFVCSKRKKSIESKFHSCAPMSV